MKKWYVLLFTSLLLFCFFLYMNDPCERIIQATRFNLSFIMLYGIDLLGFTIPWFVVSLLGILSLAAFILALQNIIRMHTRRIKWLFLLTAVIPLFSILFAAFEKEYIYETNPPLIMSDPPVEPVYSYKLVSVDEQKNEVVFVKYKTLEIIYLRIPHSSIISLNERIAAKNYIVFYIRYNRLLGTHRLDAILSFSSESSVSYRSRLQPFHDFMSSNVTSFFKSLPYLILPKPTPTPAPTAAPSN